MRTTAMLSALRFCLICSSSELSCLGNPAKLRGYLFCFVWTGSSFLRVGLGRWRSPFFVWVSSETLPKLFNLTEVVMFGKVLFLPVVASLGLGLVMVSPAAAVTSKCTATKGVNVNVLWNYSKSGKASPYYTFLTGPGASKFVISKKPKATTGSSFKVRVKSVATSKKFTCYADIQHNI